MIDNYCIMKTNKLILSFCLVAAMLLVSCGPVKDVAYFQNRMVDHPEKIDKHAGIVIQPKDMLSIVVNSRNPELAAMFNLPIVSYAAGAEVKSLGSYSQRISGYVVDNDGMIDFPVLGQICVPGLVTSPRTETLKLRNSTVTTASVKS